MLSKVLTLVSRILLLAYVVLAFLTFPEARKLLKSNFHVNGSTLYMPLIFCDYETIAFDGSVLSFDTTSIEGCTTLDFLVNAAAASLIVSAAASLLFLLADALYRVGTLRNTWVKTSTLLGFAIFLIFILIQAAISSWALAAEAQRHLEYTDGVFEKIGFYEAYGFDQLKSHGEATWLWVAGGAAILAGTGVLLDSLVNVLCAPADSGAGSPSSTTDFKSSLQSLELSSAPMTPTPATPPGEVNMSVGLPETKGANPWSTL